MPKLVRYIQGTISTPIITESILVRNVTAMIQGEDYVNMYGHIEFLQNLSEVDDSYLLKKPNKFGLNSLNQPNNTANNAMISLIVNY